VALIRNDMLWLPDNRAQDVTVVSLRRLTHGVERSHYQGEVIWRDFREVG